MPRREAGRARRNLARLAVVLVAAGRFLVFDGAALERFADRLLDRLDESVDIPFLHDCTGLHAIPKEC